MEKEIYFKICEYTYNANLIAVEELFDCSDFESLGAYIFEIIKDNCLDDVDNVDTLKQALLHPRKIEDYNNDNFYEILSKEICRFEILPSATLLDGTQVVNKIVAEANKIIQEYEEKNTDINDTVDELTSKIDDVKNKIRSSTDILKSLKQLEAQKVTLSNDRRLLDLELQQRQHIYLHFQEAFSDILCEETRTNELYKNSVRASKKHRSSGINELYISYKMDIDVFKGLFEQYDNVFYKSKFYYLYDTIQKKYYYEFTKKQEQEDVIKRLKQEVDSLPKIKDLRSLRATNLEAYKEVLKKLVEQYEIVSFIKEGLETNYCLVERKSFLSKCLELYINQDYEMFNNLVASQIEGMFNDFLKDITTYLRLEDFRQLDIPILRKVLEFLGDVGKSIHLEIYLYFFYYFVDQVRNPIAHGDYTKCIKDIDDEILAVELILDMATVIYLIQDFSESSRMRDFFKNFFKVFFYKDNPSDSEFYGCITNELLGERMHSGYQKIEFMDEIEVLYWTFNSYYQERIEFYEITEEVARFKRIVCSEEYWSYINENLDKLLAEEFCEYKFSSDFRFVVCRMFPIAREYNTAIIPLLVESKRKLDVLF